MKSSASARFAHETVYPGETTNSNLYGGLTDIATGAGGCAIVSPLPATISNSIKARRLRRQLARSGIRPTSSPSAPRASTAPAWAATATPRWPMSLPTPPAILRPSTTSPACSLLKPHPTPRLTIYLNYGGDYAGRDDYGTASATTLGAPSADFCPTQRQAPLPAPATPTAADIAAGGTWGGHWGTPCTRPQSATARGC